MPIEMPTNEFDQFCDFVVHMRQQGIHTLSPERSVQEFRDYQEQLRHWSVRNQTSAEQALRGEAVVLDDASVLKRLRERLAREGLVD